MRGLRRDTAGAVGTEAAAYALETEAAFDGLTFHTVVGCFHGKTCYVTFQWFVCALTGCAAVTLIHDGYLLLKYMVCIGLNIIKWIKIIHFWSKLK